MCDLVLKRCPVYKAASRADIGFDLASIEIGQAEWIFIVSELCQKVAGGPGMLLESRDAGTPNILKVSAVFVR
jgi:hypothetical protein